MASSYASLSALLRAAGRRAEALTYAQVTLEAKQRAFGPQHVEVAGAMLHLADLLHDLGRCISIVYSNFRVFVSLNAEALACPEQNFCGQVSVLTPSNTGMGVVLVPSRRHNLR